MHAELEGLNTRVLGTALLKGVLDKNWFQSVSKSIDEMGPDLNFSDQ